MQGREGGVWAGRAWGEALKRVSCVPSPAQEAGLASAECRDRSVECGLWSGSAECEGGMWSAGRRGVWAVGC